MPHIIIEYSANLEERMDLPGLINKLHLTTVGMEWFSLAAARTRAERRDYYRIADNNPENGFVHVVVRIGHGRSLEVKQQAGKVLFEVLCDHLQPIYDTSPLGITLEIQEIDPDLSWRKNNLHERLAKKGDH
jgi:5-carboxymethyl-2-hydroxymuconate isomerase